MIHLAALVRAHRRADTLRVALTELDRYADFPGLKVSTIVFEDRCPTSFLDIYASLRHPPTVVAVDVPILGAGRERFLEAQNSHLSHMERLLGSPDWVYVCDDDFWFEPEKITDTLVPALSNHEVDAYYCPCLFLQDAPDTYNPDRQHESIRLYRHLPRARFSGKRMLSMPDGPHDAAVISSRTARFPVPLLEYGGFTPEDRGRVVASYRAANKDDAFTRSLLSPRRLRFPTDYDPHYGPWRSLYPCAPSTLTTTKAAASPEPATCASPVPVPMAATGA